MAAIAVPRVRWLPRALFAITAALVGLIVVSVGAAVVLHGTTHDAGIPLTSIGSTPRLVEVNGYAAVVVEVGGARRAFVPVDSRNDPLTYCEGRSGPGMFTTRLWGSQFTLDGRKIGGPAPRGLDSYKARIRGNHLVVDPHHVLRSSPVGQDTPAIKWNDFRTLDPDYCPPRRTVDAIVRSHT